MLQSLGVMTVRNALGIYLPKEAVMAVNCCINADSSFHNFINFIKMHTWVLFYSEVGGFFGDFLVATLLQFPQFYFRIS